jgi:hypothetical protein
MKLLAFRKVCLLVCYRFGHKSNKISLIFLLLLAFLCFEQASAQEIIPKDSLERQAQSAPPKDTIRKKPSDIKTTIIFSAKDSVILEVESKKGILYEDAKITYGDTRLNSGLIIMDMQRNTVLARPRIDSTGKAQGRPILEEGQEKIVADSIDYNTKSQRAMVSNLVTQQGEGYIGGNRVKKSPENEFYLNEGYYTTCNLAEPHFRIKARKIKLTKKQNVIAGPFNIEIADTPLPLGFFFGIFPKPQQKASGIVVPVYGESRENGFFLRDGGYYWAVNERLDLTFLGEIYSYGAWGLRTTSNYNKRYAYSGNFNLTFNKRFEDSNIDIDRTEIRQFWINWAHRPVPKGTSQFSASVSAGSLQFNRNSTFDLQNQLNNNFQSTISYSKTFKGTPFNLTLSGRHNQESNTGAVNLTLPDFNFAMNRIFPFRSKTGSTQGFLNNINVGYNLTSSTQISNRIAGTSAAGFRVAGERRDSTYAFNAENLPLLWDNADITARHTIPISAPFKLLKYLNGTVSSTFNQTFYTERYAYTWLPETQRVRIDTSRQIGSSYQYNVGGNLATNIYGTFVFRKSKRLQAVRHLIQPNVGLTYTPDFTGENFGFFQRDVQVGVNPDNSPLLRDLPVFRGLAAGRASAAINFSVRNSIEAKLKPKSDSANAKPVKIMLLDELSLSGNYNILADSFNLSNLNVNARTRIANFLDINMTGTLDPYAYRSIQTGSVGVGDDGSPVFGNFRESPRRLNQYAWQAGQGVGQLTNASFFISTSLNPSVFGGKPNTAPPPRNPNDPNNPLLNPTANPLPIDESRQVTRSDPAVYVDFDIPWSLNLGYTLTYTRFPQVNVRQNLTFSGDASLTPKWRIGFNSAYDFTAQQFTATQINLTRDLHCWEMRFFWQPFGQFQSYNFAINVKSNTLRDLKLERRRTWYDR